MASGADKRRRRKAASVHPASSPISAKTSLTIFLSVSNSPAGCIRAPIPAVPARTAIFTSPIPKSWARAARGDARVELHVGTLEPRTAVGGIDPPRAARAHDFGIGDVKIAGRAGTAGIGERIPPAGELDTDRMIVSEGFAEIGDDAGWTDAALRLRRLSAPDAIAKTGDLHAGTRLVDQGIHRLCSVVTRQAGQGDGAYGFDAAVERGGAELIIGLETGGIEITIPQRHGGIGVEAMRRMAEHADLTRPAVIARGIEPGRAQIVLGIEYPAISDAPHQPQHDRDGQ